jgi:hypothetical protein
MKNINETGAYNDQIVGTMRDAIKQFKATQSW